MNREIDNKVKVIINQATKEAKNFYDVKVRPEHLVLSILMDGDNACISVLMKMNVDTQSLGDNITQFLRAIDLTPRTDAVLSKNKTLPFSDETKLIIKGLDKECEKLNDNIIDTTHIMLAILISRFPITEKLAEQGVTYNNFKR